MNIQHRNGLLAEIKAMEHYVNLGYEVYTPLCTQSRADLIVCNKEGEVLKVQVKKLTWTTTGKRQYLSTRLKSRNKKSSDMYKENDFDILFCIDEDDRIFIFAFEDIKDKTSIQVDKRDVKETH